MKSFDKLKAKLAELFQLDQADLDFGIYRIMNARRKDIDQFLERDLLPQVREAFKQYQSSDKVEIQKELDKVVEGVKAAGMDPEQAPKVKEFRARLAGEAVDVAALENEVYDHLCSFFGRYYDEGDFISLRRYKEGVYAIPYEGEEVKLHWANADQYYIKTTENFKDYAFKVGGDQRVHFKIVEADTEKDNVKATNGKDRRFLLHGDNPVAEENGELAIRFEYKPDEDKRKQDAINADTVRRVIEYLNDEKLAVWQHRLSAKWKRADGTATERTILEKRLSDYTQRNTFDYFIHKDLGGFLRRELDFYIKNEVMRLDDVEEESVPRVEQYLSKIKVIRKIAHKLIDFLAQIEDFQKKLWLKKKFVIETNYCITLDRVPEDLYPEIVKNDAQREEWVRLFAIDEIKKDLAGTIDYSQPLTLNFLKANQYLVLDTAFFDDNFKADLLKSFDELNEQTEGLLVHAENFQALNLLQQKYTGNISAVYIDPPYNSDATPIVYKNDYKDSSWLSLIYDRIALSLPMLNSNACYAIAIDDFELPHLCELTDLLFKGYDRNMVVVNHHPQGGMSNNISRTHEYMLMMTPKGKDILMGKEKSGEAEQRSFMLSGPGDNKSRTGRPNSFYAILLDAKEKKIVGFEPPPALGEIYPKSKTAEGYERIYPINQAGEEKVWCRTYESAVIGLTNGEIAVTKEGSIKLVVDTKEKRFSLMSNWTDSRYNAGPHGTALVANMIGNREAFSYPKSIHTVVDAIEAMTWQYKFPVIVDFFAGSGTTGHAIINLNRSDNGRRKYILIEVGSYFDNVTKPRTEKALYAESWKDGKPVSRDGISHMFKYIRLESYEDALANIRMGRTQAQKTLLDKASGFRESYLLKYMLDSEAKGSQTLLNIENFEDPFSYQLLVGTGSVGETKPVNVDLVETFNWLLGLKVRRMDSIKGFRVIEGENPKGEKVLVIWRKIRDLSEADPKKVQAARENANLDLEDFFRKQQYNTLDSEFDVIYVNGDNNLLNVPLDPEKEGVEPRYKVRLIEEEFKRLMFDVKDV